jgi:hypothetical protein
MDMEDLYRLLRTGHMQAQGIVDTIDTPVAVLDESFCVVETNAAFCDSFTRAGRSHSRVMTPFRWP